MDIKGELNKELRTMFQELVCCNDEDFIFFIQSSKIELERMKHPKAKKLFEILIKHIEIAREKNKKNSPKATAIAEGKNEKYENK